jgi:uncharacterized membrane protein YqjE
VTEAGTTTGQAGTATGPTPPPPAGHELHHLFGGLLSDLRVSLHGRLELMSLELQQAGSALTQIVILAVATGVLLCGAWLTLMVALFMGAVEGGMHWGAAIAIVFFINLGVAGLLYLRAFSLTRYLSFPATVRSLSSGLTPSSVDEPAALPADAAGGRHDASR